MMFFEKTPVLNKELLDKLLEISDAAYSFREGAGLTPSAEQLVAQRLAWDSIDLFHSLQQRVEDQSLHLERWEAVNIRRVLREGKQFLEE